MCARPIQFIVITLFLLLVVSSQAFAGDAATVVFKSGQVVRIDDGFKEIVSSLRSLDGKEDKHKIVELNIGGGTFLLNVSEVVIVCRDSCSTLTIQHQLDPKRGSRDS